MALLIRNAEIVNADARSRGDIYVEDERISKIGTNLEAPAGAEVIDAAGKLVVRPMCDLVPAARFAESERKASVVA